jgi:myosin heavy chain 9/10/11/14
MLQEKETALAQLDSELDILKREHGQSLKEKTELQARIDALHRELETQKGDRDRGSAIRAKLQEELKVQLDSLTRDYAVLEQNNTVVIERERELQAQLMKTQASFSDLEKAKRSSESELLSIRNRQSDMENQLVDTQRAREVNRCFDRNTDSLHFSGLGTSA